MNDQSKQPDEYVEQLLRDVEIPNDLHSQLLKLPELNEEANVVEQTHQTAQRMRTRWLPILVLAASVCAVAAFLNKDALFSILPVGAPTAQNDPDVTSSNNTGSKNNNEETTQPEHPGTSTQSNSSPQQLLAQIRQAQQAMDLVHLEIENFGLESKIKQSDQFTAKRIEQREVNSLVLAVADGTLLKLGGSETNVKKDMASIVSQYKGTQGALLADQVLNNLTN